MQAGRQPPAGVELRWPVVHHARTARMRRSSASAMASIAGQTIALSASMRLLSWKTLGPSFLRSMVLSKPARAAGRASSVEGRACVVS
jgi:hypothetical protein